MTIESTVKSIETVESAIESVAGNSTKTTVIKPTCDCHKKSKRYEKLYIESKLKSNPRVFDKLINNLNKIDTDAVVDTNFVVDDIDNIENVDKRVNSVWSFVELNIPYYSMVYLKLFVNNNEMLEKINDYNNLVSTYYKLIKNRKGNKKSQIIFDINKIKSFDDLEIEMNKCENIIIQYNNKQKLLGKLEFSESELEICINNQNVMVYCPLTFEAAKHFGHQTDWCTS